MSQEAPEDRERRGLWGDFVWVACFIGGFDTRETALAWKEKFCNTSTMALFCKGMIFLASSWLFLSCISTLRNYQLQDYHYYSPNVPAALDQYRITLISDIHIWDPRDLLRAESRQARLDYLRLLEIRLLLQRQQSQLLLLAGDYLSYGKQVRADFDLRPYFQLLPQPRDGIVAVLGNHDHFLLPRSPANPSVQALRDASAEILVNRQHTIRTTQGAALHIVGMDDYLYGKRERPKRLFAGLESEDFVLVLAHNPDSFDLLQRPGLVDLALAGHLHGGQVTLFGLAPVVPGQRKYLRQPFQTKHFPVLVSNGLGASRLQLRIMAPPQIWTIILHRQRNLAAGAPKPPSEKLSAIKPKYPEQPYRLLRSPPKMVRIPVSGDRR